MNDLAKRLEIKAGMIELGERIAWGSDSAIMREAAARIRTLEHALEAGTMLYEIDRITADRDHWKSNHDNQVRVARILKERTDMPVERTKAYEQWRRDIAEIERMRDEIAALRTADTCARQCEAQAYRHEAQQQKHRAETAEQALADLGVTPAEAKAGVERSNANRRDAERYRALAKAGHNAELCGERSESERAPS